MRNRTEKEAKEEHPTNLRESGPGRGSGGLHPSGLGLGRARQGGSFRLFLILGGGDSWGRASFQEREHTELKREKRAEM